MSKVTGFEGPPPTGDTPTVAGCSVRISRPLDVVKQQLLELDEKLLTVALRGAAEPSEGASPRPAAVDVHVRVGRWQGGPEFVAIPITLEVSRCGFPAALRGEFELRAISPVEVEVGVGMVSPPGALQQHEEEAPDRPVFEVVTRSFLNCVFWTLEARSRHDGLTRPGADCLRDGR